jgi:hypothetical protein
MRPESVETDEACEFDLVSFIKLHELKAKTLHSGLKWCLNIRPGEKCVTPRLNRRLAAHREATQKNDPSIG